MTTTTSSPSTVIAVAATSATNAWAVGRTFTKTTMIPLIEHWNGTAWRQVPGPALPAGAALKGIAAASAH
jgi:hypothetical protein